MSIFGVGGTNPWLHPFVPSARPDTTPSASAAGAGPAQVASAPEGPRAGAQVASLMGALGSALASGDIGGANGAYGSLQNLVLQGNARVPQYFQLGGTGGYQTVTGPSGAMHDGLAQAFGALGSALDGPDVASARDAFGQLQQLMANGAYGGPGANAPVAPDAIG